MNHRNTGWNIFSAAPHRVMMFGGAVQFVASLLFWGTELTGRYTELWSPLQTSVPTTFAHAFLMLFTLFPFFFFGFLMTTYPRWMGGTPIAKPAYVTPFVLLASGLGLFYVGLFYARAVASLGALVFLAGFLAGYRALWAVYRTAPSRDKFYETALNVALAMGALGIAAFAGWLLTESWPLYAFVRSAGLWWFLVPVILTVGHRMIPFFSSCVLDDYQVFQPKVTLVAMLVLSFGHGALEMAGAEGWAWLVDGPFAALVLYHAWRWGVARSFSIRLLAVLHIAFVWLGVALAMYAVQGVWIATGESWAMERGPLHLVAIGAIASLTIGMATRVTLGHSGRPLEMDTFTWAIFWAIGAAAVLRFLAAMPLPMASHFNLGAAAVWLLAAGLWASRYGLMYLRPRVDGKPG